MPNAIPTGVAKENNIYSLRALFLSSSFLKFLDRDIPSDIDAGILWKSRPSIILNVAARSLVKPSAIPSNKACVLNATKSTIDIMLKLEQHF
jgi:hypothetical protein